MRIFQVSLPILLLLPVAASICRAADITYDVNLTIGAGSVTGDIITDGTIGTLFDSDIVDWNLLVNDGTHTFDLTGPLSGDNSAFDVTLEGLTATATDLLYDFDNGNEAEFYYTGFLPVNVCFISSGAPDCTGSGYGAGEALIVCQVYPGCYGSSDSDSQYAALTGTQVIAGPESSPGTPEPSTCVLLSIGFGVLTYRLHFRGKRSPKHTSSN